MKQPSSPPSPSPSAAPLPLPSGLVNSGNTCYLNSLLQSIYNIPYVRRHAQLPLSGVFDELSAGRAARTVPLTNLLGIDVREQRDAGEFFKELLREQLAPDAVEAFTGSVLEEITLDRAEAGEEATVRSKEVPFTDLTVPLTSSATTIPRALAEYFKPQPMSYRKKSATRSESLASLPPVLAVTLGRFEASFANNRLSLTKLHTPVRLPTRLELPVPSSAPPETLRLAAVIVHKGEFEYGHYYAYVNRKPLEEGGDWARCDDTRVAKVTLEEVLKDSEGKRGRWGKSQGYGGRGAQAYIVFQMELHAASASAGSIAFAALRLAGADTLGCDLACDSSCSIKRVKLDATTLSLDVDLSSAVNSDTGNTKPSHQSRLVTAECNDDGTISLEYSQDALGNVIPDFSMVGYRGGAEEIPTVATVATIDAVEGEEDATARIQAAIDTVAALPLEERGALLFGAGTFRVLTTLYIRASGVVLRGQADGGTTLLSTSTTNADILLVVGSGDSSGEVAGTRVAITDDYVATGSFTLSVESTASYEVGDLIEIERAVSEAWITSIGMDAIPDCEEPDCYQWEADSYELMWGREVAEVVDETTLRLNAPIVHPIQSEFGGGSVHKVEWASEGRLSEVGVEDLRYASEFDEDHAWDAVRFEEVEDSWVRRIECWGFADSCVDLQDDSKTTTVMDCSSYDQASIITGGRRYSFNSDGVLNLVKGCYARNGRHDYVQGSKTGGPNVFYDSSAEVAHADIGPHHRYATGTLWDNLKGGQMRAWDRGNMGSGHGWSGAVQVFWNALVTGERAASGELQDLVIDSPAGASNYGIGCVSDEVGGGGIHDSSGLHVFPKSLYAAQLAERTGSQYFEVRAGGVPAAHEGEFADMLVEDLSEAADDGTLADQVQQADGGGKLGDDVGVEKVEAEQVWVPPDHLLKSGAAASRLFGLSLIQIGAVGGALLAAGCGGCALSVVTAVRDRGAGGGGGRMSLQDFEIGWFKKGRGSSGTEREANKDLELVGFGDLRGSEFAAENPMQKKN
ncbi:hypothetical protein TeGR_g12933 [Tetraparma gracilis]|uniref:ubiquitinyl hydrolase 1 n=1 Tax=Tetraparma gracilis TaxID=2962635 RepID=A0ABQ6N085_9STRA|nr:hypothetical protein TeGR_g12933 [Tetraparma gracilis]